MKAYLAALSVAYTIALPITSASAATPAGDELLFKCTTGAKGAFLYARKGPDGQPLGPQYVSTSSGKPEFTYPATPDRTRAVFGFSRRGFAGGGEYHVTFHNGPYTYIVWDKTTVADNQSLPDFKSGVIVLQGGKLVANRRCKDEREAHISTSARTYMKAEPFTEVQGIP